MPSGPVDVPQTFLVAQGESVDPTPVVLALMERAAGDGTVHWAQVTVEHPASGAAGLSRVCSQFRFTSYPTEECLELEACYLSNAGGSRDVFTCRASVRRPGLDVEQGLQLANDLNRLGWANAYFCPSDKLLVVSKRSAVEQVAGTGGVSDESFTRSPLDLFFTAVLATALAALRLAPQEVLIGDGQRLWSANPLSNSSDAFACWVISRLLRWGAATLELNSPAFNVVVDAGAACLALVIREASESRDYGWTETEEQDLRARVSGWISDSPALASQDGRMFDLVLHDLDHICEWALRDQIPSSACAAEDVYFSLFAKSLQGHPEVWKGVVLANEDLTVVASIAFNLTADQVSKEKAARYFGGFPLVTGKEITFSARISDECWVFPRRGPVSPVLLTREILCLFPFGLEIP